MFCVVKDGWCGFFLEVASIDFLDRGEVWLIVLEGGRLFRSCFTMGLVNLGSLG